jgi:5-methylcytosine-specific restriction protein A
VTESWTCVSHKKIKPGDRAFFSKVGAEPRGIFSSGQISSQPFLSRGRNGKDIHCVMIEFDVLLDPDTTPILTLDILAIGKLEKQLWTPQSSGISIKPEYAEELELVWKDFLQNQ